MIAHWKWTHCIAAAVNEESHSNLFLLLDCRSLLQHGVFKQAAYAVLRFLLGFLGLFFLRDRVELFSF